MSKKELMKLADSFQKKADTAFQNYQETGASRYDSAFRRNEDIAAALRAAAEAADEHNAYINLKMEMSNFASRARRVMLTIRPGRSSRTQLSSTGTTPEPPSIVGTCWAGWRLCRPPPTPRAARRQSDEGVHREGHVHHDADRRG